jgi:dipeptidyl aminopeptidase/acylaminoacyl peptidase
MQGRGQRARVPQTLALLLSLLFACVDGPTGPGSQVPARVRLDVLLPARTPASWLPRGDTLRVLVRRAGRVEPILDTADVADSLTARLVVPLEQAVERFVASAEVVYAGQVLFLAFDAIQLRAGLDTAITLTAVYVGPGGAATSLAVAATDSTLESGDTTRIVPTALDSLGQLLGRVPVRFLTPRPDLFAVDTAGLVTALDGMPDSTLVDVVMPTGLTASLPLWLIGSLIPLNGQTVVFISTRDGNREVYAMQADGTGAVRLTESPEDESFPAWAPGAGAIAFERDVDDERQIFTLNLADGTVAQLTTEGDNIRPRYSPDGRQIGFTSLRDGDPAIWVMAADGGNQRRLMDPGTPQDDDEAQYPVGDYFGDWSPDGAMIAYAHYECSSDGCFGDLLFADSAGASGIFPGFGGAADGRYAVRWSPQGWRVLTTAVDVDTALDRGDLGPPPDSLPDHSPTFDANAAFAGSWDRFVFESEDGGVHGIYVGGFGSTGTRLSPAGIAEFEPDYAPGPPSYLVSLEISGDVATPIPPGETRQLTAGARDQTGTSITPESAGQWSVRPAYPDFYVAAVDSAGLVTARVAGAAGIIYAVGSVFADTVTVTVPLVSGNFGTTGSMTSSHTGGAAVTLNDGSVLVVGGLTTGGDRYDPASGTFAATPGGLTLFREGLTATGLPDGRVLVAGGGQVFPSTTCTAELFDPSTGLFSLTDSLGDSVVAAARGRRYHTATALADGRVLVVGGEGVASSVLYRLRTAEIYDVTTESFTVVASPDRTRSRHAAALLPDGRVLVTGGQTNFNDIGDPHAALFSPASGTWAATGAMSTGRNGHTATLLADGRVLVTGGSALRQDASRRLATAELYDPSTGTFTATGSMSVRRQDHFAILLPNGKVLVGGGRDQNNGFPTVAELYDPTTGTFTPTGGMALGGDRMAVALLPDGRVLIAGGSAAQVYLP